jgi:hypothetical protein
MRAKALAKWETTLVFRRNRSLRWMWELLAHDRHVLNRSERDFASKQECMLDAIEKGQTLTSKSMI